MKPTLPRFHGFAALMGFYLVFSGFALAANRAEPATRMADRLMFVTTDLTKAGEQVAPPTADRPTYYVPVFVGYSDMSAPWDYYQRKPAEEPIQRAVIAALAKQHYRLASRAHPPTMTIAFEWGTVTPSSATGEEIRTRVLGETSKDPDWVGPVYRPEMTSLSGKHFLIISAFAYQRKVTQESNVLLWRAHSSTEHWGYYLDDAIQPLIAVAAPELGRVAKPGARWYDKYGRVEIGDAVVY